METIQKICVSRATVKLFDSRCHARLYCKALFTVAVYPELVEGSQTCTFLKSTGLSQSLNAPGFTGIIVFSSCRLSNKRLLNYIPPVSIILYFNNCPVIIKRIRSSIFDRTIYNNIVGETSGNFLDNIDTPYY